jgi:hypothetical protein
MIRGMHAMFYSSQPEALRAFLGDKLGLAGRDVGGGWLIFDAPDADLGCIRQKAAKPYLEPRTSLSIATISFKPSANCVDAVWNSRKKLKTPAMGSLRFSKSRVASRCSSTKPNTRRVHVSRGERPNRRSTPTPAGGPSAGRWGRLNLRC